MSGIAFAAAQEIPSAHAERLFSDRSVLIFNERPKSLDLLPSFPGDALFRERHAALRPHFTQEGLFLLAGEHIRLDRAAIGRILDSVPSLADLAYPDEKSGEPEILFKFARIVGDPEVKDGSLYFVLETGDVDFGTARFEVTMLPKDDYIELHLVNLDSLKFLLIPSVRPGKALIDLLYFPMAAEPFVYVAWSVRATVPIPGFLEIERPLRHRATAIKDWYIGQMGSGGK